MLLAYGISWFSYDGAHTLVLLKKVKMHDICAARPFLFCTMDALNHFRLVIVNRKRNTCTCAHLPNTRMLNRDQYRKSIRGVSSLAVEESKCTPSLEFSELFSLKSIYVKYKNAILSQIDCLLCT